MFREMIIGLLKIIFGGILGATGKFLWDRYFCDRAMSTQQLLEKDVLTRHGRHRLRKETYDTLNWLRTIWKPPNTGTKLSSWPEKSETVFARSCDTFYGDTACPCGEAVFIWLKSGNSREKLVHDLNQELDSLLPDGSLSKKLLQKEFDASLKAKVWIMALNIEVRSRSEMVDLLFNLSETVRKRIFNASIILEVYLPYDVFNDEYLIDTRYKSIVINTKALTPKWKPKINIHLTTLAMAFIMLLKELKQAIF